MRPSAISDLRPATLLACRRDQGRRKLPAAYVNVELLISLVARAGLAAK